jgi:hypothetical protein
MSLSRESSMSTLSLYERLDQVRKQSQQLRHDDSFDLAFLPNEILLAILAKVSQKCNRTGKMSDLLNCTLVDKRYDSIDLRFHYFATAFLYCNVYLSTERGILALLSVIRNNDLARGKLVQRLTLYNISFISGTIWSELLCLCPNLGYLCLERCYVEGTPQEPSFELKHLRTLVMSDCATCPVTPVLKLCKKSTRLEKLSIMGCNYNEEDMCEMISNTPWLREIKLGSHAGASLTTSGSAGGDKFARVISEHCPHLVSADLTGIISMTDEGWVPFMNVCGPTLERLCVRRAMQISLEALQMVSSCSQLTKLTIANVPHLNDATIIHILDSIGSQLHFLHLESLEITNDTLEAVAKHCTKLLQLRIYSCNQLHSLNPILYSPELGFLRYLVLHNCRDLDAHLECEHKEDRVLDVDSSTLPSVAKIKYVSTERFSPPSPCFPTSDFAKGSCPIKVYLKHLEIVDCPFLSEDAIDLLLTHSQRMTRFVYVGESLDSRIRKKLKLKKQLKYSIYVLTPTTPHFQ